MKLSTFIFPIRILIVFLLLSSINLFSQAPQSFKYQAVARESNGSILANKNIVTRITIRDTALNGTIQYQETHNSTTSSLGLINFNIGQGFVIAGTFTAITWGNGDKYLEVEIDYGSGYVSISNSQLLSVPYALYAGNCPPGPIGPQGPQGIQGLTGPQGLQGPVGLSLNWLGSFSSAPSTPSLNDAYYDSVAKKSFVWNGTSWNILSQDGNDGAQGIQGIQGPQGNQGLQGPVGISLNWLGEFTSAPVSPNLNDAYHDITAKKSFVWNGSSWTVIAKDGATGPQGTAYFSIIQYINSSGQTIADSTDLVVFNTETTVTLPFAANVPKGKVIAFTKDNISSTNICYINAQSGDLIIGVVGGINSAQLNGYANTANLIIISDGVNRWYSISH